ncbi:MAG: hypothetical protein RQ760_01470 [Sedimentisphaerales bacterium]|nr:hypothetical protein [Sedimentisphaerales bacterium]
MNRKDYLALLQVSLIALCCGCTINKSSTEIRKDEQMLEVSFENDKAKDLVNTVIYETKREYKEVARIGIPFFSVYSRYERPAFNAHCNDHIRTMDKNGDLFITLHEAESYYKAVIPANDNTK